MLSEENRKKISFSGIYVGGPKESFVNKYPYYTFVPKTTIHDKIIMVDTYFGEVYEVTNQNIDSFELLFDMNDVEEMEKPTADCYRVVLDPSGKHRYFKRRENGVI